MRPRSQPICGHRVPNVSRAIAATAKAGIFPSMLPGFRFLFAAILLCVSILIFGLGAAALLRAAHEEFASKPSWRGAPEASFAQHSAAPRPPVLALLKLEPKPEEQMEAGRPIATAPADAPAAAPAPTQGQPQGTTI